MTTQVREISAKNVWGKVVLYLKERKLIALHVACGDITDVELKDHKLVINVYDGMLLNLLYAGRKDIEGALRWQGLDLELEIVVKENQTTIAQRDYQKLLKVFEEVDFISRKI